MTTTDYHSIRAVSSTWLRNCNPPAKLAHRIIYPIVPTEEMRLGTDIHTVVLENCYAPIFETKWKPEGLKLSTKEGKAWKESIPDGVRWETEDYRQSLNGCVKALTEHPNPILRELRSSAESEQVFQWEEDGCPCKAMLDSQSRGFIADIKTGSGEGFASPERFRRIAFDRELHIQAAWYMHAASIFGKPADKFVFIAVETTPPYLLSVFECDREFLNAGIEEIDRRFPMIKHGLETGEWPGYPTESTTLSLPLRKLK